MGGLWRTLSLCLHSPLISRIFATVSPLLWLWSTVICWHACGTNGLSHRCLPYYQRCTHWASVKYILKKTWRVSLSIGVRNTMIRWVVYLLRIFKMFHGLTNNPVFVGPQYGTSSVTLLALRILKLLLIFGKTYAPLCLICCWSLHDFCVRRDVTSVIMRHLKCLFSFSICTKILVIFSTIIAVNSADVGFFSLMLHKSLQSQNF